MYKTSYSKKIVYWTGLLFGFQIICGLVFSWFGRDTSLFIYTIPSTGGVFGASIIFYLNKAKLENVLKIKIDYTKFKLSISKLIPPEALIEVENEFMALENALNDKIDTTVSTTVSDDVDIPLY